MLHVRIEPRESKKAKSGYTYRYIIPADKDYGIEKDIKKGSFRTKKDAMEAGNLRIQEILKGIKPNATKVTLDDVWQEYKELERGHLKPHTLEGYACTYKVHIKPKLGEKRIRLLDYKQLQLFFNDVSPTMAPTIKKVVNIIFKTAVRLGYIPYSPTHEIKLPKREIPDEDDRKDFLIEPERLYEILDHINIEGYKRMVWLGYFLGLRLGEALGLDWKDIDFEKGKAYIHQQVNTKDELTQDLKTPSSKATIPVAKPLLEMMKEWKKDGCPHVVHDKHGKRANYQAARSCFKKIDHFKFHALRHTYITNLVQCTPSIKTVMKLARHSNIETTLKYYTEVTTDMMDEAIEATFPNLPQK